MLHTQLHESVADVLQHIVGQEIPEEFVHRISGERMAAYRRAIEEGHDEAEACRIAASGVRSTPGFRDLLRYLR